MNYGAATTTHNTVFPKLEDDECGWDASGTPVRYAKCLLNVELFGHDYFRVDLHAEVQHHQMMIKIVIFRVGY